MCIRDSIVGDEHLAVRNMLVEVPRPDGVDQAVLVPGNPVKMSATPEGPETRPPWLGEHTDGVLGRELGLDAGAIAALRDRGVVG